MSARLKLTAALLGVALLAGCTDEERADQRTIIKSKLPPGCEVTDVGEYGAFNHVLVVTCEGKKTASLSAIDNRQCGNSICRHNVMTFGVGEPS